MYNIYKQFCRICGHSKCTHIFSRLLHTHTYTLYTIPINLYNLYPRAHNIIHTHTYIVQFRYLRALSTNAAAPSDHHPLLFRSIMFFFDTHRTFFCRLVFPSRTRRAVCVCVRFLRRLWWGIAGAAASAQRIKKLIHPKLQHFFLQMFFSCADKKNRSHNRFQSICQQNHEPLKYSFRANARIFILD